jgi:hypothetical protein
MPLPDFRESVRQLFDECLEHCRPDDPTVPHRICFRGALDFGELSRAVPLWFLPSFFPRRKQEPHYKGTKTQRRDEIKISAAAQSVRGLGDRRFRLFAGDIDAPSGTGLFA